MNASRVLGVIATILFGVAFVLLLVGGGDKNTVEELGFLGLACFAGAHVL